ncbi:hypothetical protein LWI29_026116 [Acer saccharum]|uniref:Uncharacterized protein n=1 Tax=Acer saccharum TaxID=4024 RepID=A0AA39RLM4_ACESA|nr:hypothetical protein LWI29_026116 [Acer saccharum]
MSQLHNTSRVTAKPRVPSTSLHFGLSKIDISTGGYAPPPNFSEKIGLRFLISLGSFLTDGALMEVQPNFTSNPALMVVQPNCRSNLRKHANKCKDNCVQQEVSDGQGASKSLFSKTMKASGMCSAASGGGGVFRKGARVVLNISLWPVWGLIRSTVRGKRKLCFMVQFKAPQR